MGVGDVIVAKLSATGNFQPAAGVQIMITCLGSAGAGDSWNWYDGANSALLVPASGGPSGSCRFPINNTIYLRYVKGTLNSIYSGVQIK